MLTVSAPGKIILSGEHAAVYNKPVLSTTIDKRIYATFKISSEQNLQLNWDKKTHKIYYSDLILKTKKARQAWQKYQKSQNQKILENIIQNELDLIHLAIGETLIQYEKFNPKTGLRIFIENSIPLSRGFGSSAALAAVVCGGISVYLSGNLDKKILEKLIHKSEQKIHGNPSGADGAIIIHGGSILFQKGRSIRFFPDLLQCFSNNFHIIDAKKPENTTGAIVAKVKDKYKKNQKKIQIILNEIEICTMKIKNALKKNNNHLLLETINKNQKLLENLGVVNTPVKKFCQAIRNSKGAAKISGAGSITKQGGGIILCFGLTKKTIQSIAEKFNFRLMENIKLGTEGFKINA